MPNKNIIEIQSISLSEFVADIGGAAGLILGLNILQILSFSIRISAKLSKVCGKISRSQIFHSGSARI